MRHISLRALPGVMGLGLLLSSPQVPQAAEVRVVGVRHGSGTSPALLLKVADDAVLSATDVSAMLDAASRRGPGTSSRQVRAALNGRRFGDMAVVAPPEPRPGVGPARKRPASPAVRSLAQKKPVTPAPAVKGPSPQVKPDVTIFDPATPSKVETPPPSAPPAQPETKKP